MSWKYTLASTDTWKYSLSSTDTWGYSIADDADPSVAGVWYVRPSGGAYESENGTTYLNAWDGFSNIVWGAGGVDAGHTLYLCGTHTETITVGEDGTDGNPILIRGDYTGDAGVIDSEDTRVTGIDITSKDYITLTSISSIDAVTQCLLIAGNSTGIITNSCTFSGCGNQGIQHRTTVSATHNNLTCDDNVDDGVSGHESATIVINTATITNNAQGLNVIADVAMTATGVTFSGNTQYDVYVAAATTPESAVITISDSVMNQDCATDRDGKLIMTNCTVNGNINYGVASTSDGYGTATDCRIIGSIRMYNTLSSASFNRCLFDGSGLSDHVIDNNGMTTVLTYCVFKNIPSVKFGVVNRADDAATINNCTFYGVSNVGRGIFSDGDITVNNNIVQGLEYGLFKFSGVFTSNNTSFYDNTNDMPNAITNNNPQTGDPDLTDPANEDFSLGASSTIKGDGVDLGGTYEDGTDVADWGDATTVPNITTKTQAASWDIGANIS